MPPSTGDRLPEFEAVCCDGETFRTRSLSETLGDRGGVLVSTGFAFSAIAENWWKRFQTYGWESFEDVPVLGFGRDGPYAQNAFLRSLGETSFRIFADVDGSIADRLDLLTDRDGMAGISSPWRSVFVLDTDREVRYVHVADDWISPIPHDEVEDAVADL